VQEIIKKDFIAIFKALGHLFRRLNLLLLWVLHLWRRKMIIKVIDTFVTYFNFSLASIDECLTCGIGLDTVGKNC
jgi:hypothetical protein